MYGLSWVVIIRSQLSAYQSLAAKCVTRGHLSHIPQYTIQNRTCACLNCEIWGRCAGGLLRLLYQCHELHDDVIKWNHFPRYWTLCAGNSPVPGEFPSQKPVTWSFDIFFDLCLNKRLCKQSWCWWFETPPDSLRRHSNVTTPHEAINPVPKTYELYGMPCYKLPLIESNLTMDMV